MFGNEGIQKRKIETYSNQSFLSMFDGKVGSKCKPVNGARKISKWCGQSVSNRTAWVLTGDKSQVQ